MTQYSSANYSNPQFTWATAGSDQFRITDLQNLGQAFEAHDHTSTNGLPVGRVVATCVLGASDQVVGRATTDTLTNKSFGTAAQDDIKATYLLSSTNGGGNWVLRESVTAPATDHRLAFRPINNPSYFQFENTDGSIAFAIRGTAGPGTGYALMNFPATDPGAGQVAANLFTFWWDATAGSGRMKIRGKDTNNSSQTGAVQVTDYGVVTVTGAAGAATLSTNVGIVTTEVMSTVAQGSFTYTITNTKVSATDIILVTLGSTGVGIPVLNNVVAGNGSFTVKVANAHTTVAFNAAITISFQVIKTV